MHYVVLAERIFLDAVVLEVVTERCVYHHLLTEHSVRKLNVVNLLSLQIRISILEHRWILSVYIRIEQRNARTAYSHVVRKTKVLHVLQIQTECHGWNYIVVSDRKIVLRTRNLLARMLVSHSCLRTEHLVVVAVTCIERANVVGIAIIQKRCVTCVSAEDVLRSRFESHG